MSASLCYNRTYVLTDVPALLITAGNVTSNRGADMEILPHKRSGIYAIVNAKNSKIYVGSAVNLNARSRHHRDALRRGDHGSGHLQRAFKLYGEEYFYFKILEYCEKEHLIEREQYYIDAFKPEYNILPTAGSHLGAKRTPETLIKMSIAQKGRTITEEMRKKISATLTGKKQTLETRQKRARMHFKEVAQYTKDGKFVRIFQSLRDAAQAVGVGNGNLTECCQQKEGRRTAGGYQWRYVNGNTPQKISPIGIYHKPNRRVRVHQYTLDGRYIASYNGIEEAQKITGIYHISCCCNGNRETAGGFIWKRAK